MFDADGAWTVAFCAGMSSCPATAVLTSLLSLQPDMRVAFSDWLYMALRRHGDTIAAAAVLAGSGSEKKLVEDTAYQARIKM